MESNKKSLINQLLIETDKLTEEADTDSVIETKKKHTEKQATIEAIKSKVKEQAEKRNFTLAEKFRKKLFEVAPEALSDLFETAQIIEKEKQIIISENEPHIISTEPTTLYKHWFPLYNILSSQESSAFGSVIKTEIFNSNTTIINEGQINTRLFFINEGRINIFSNFKGNRFLVKSLEPGAIAGAETFFSVKQSKTSLEVIKGSVIDYIERKDFNRLSVRYPGFETKLFKFSLNCDSDIDFTQKNGMDRRIFKRFSVSGIVGMQIIIPSGKSIGKPIRGNLVDISRGGLAFEIKTAHESPEKLLKGKIANIVMDISKIKPISDLVWGGAIVSVNNITDFLYSIHFKGKKVSPTIIDILKKIRNEEKQINEKLKNNCDHSSNSIITRNFEATVLGKMYESSKTKND